jgi:hypothetical protein
MPDPVWCQRDDVTGGLADEEEYAAAASRRNYNTRVRNCSIGIVVVK